MNNLYKSFFRGNFHIIYSKSGVLGGQDGVIAPKWQKFWILFLIISWVL